LDKDVDKDEVRKRRRIGIDATSNSEGAVFLIHIFGCRELTERVPGRHELKDHYAKGTGPREDCI
jgi:hypothetical protein